MGRHQSSPPRQPCGGQSTQVRSRKEHRAEARSPEAGQDPVEGQSSRGSPSNHGDPEWPEDKGVWLNTLTGVGHGCSRVASARGVPCTFQHKTGLRSPSVGTPRRGQRGLRGSSPPTLLRREAAAQPGPNPRPASLPGFWHLSQPSLTHTPTLTHLVPVVAQPPLPSWPKPPSPELPQTRLWLTWVAVVHPLGQEQGPTRAGSVGANAWPGTPSSRR